MPRIPSEPGLGTGRIQFGHRPGWCSWTGGVRRSGRPPGGLRRGMGGSGRIRPVDLQPGPACQRRFSAPSACPSLTALPAHPPATGPRAAPISTSTFLGTALVADQLTRMVACPGVDTGADCAAEGGDPVVEPGGRGDRVVESGVETPCGELGPEIAGPPPTVSCLRSPQLRGFRAVISGSGPNRPHPGIPARSVAESWISVVARPDREHGSTTRPNCPKHRSTPPRRADPTSGVALTDQIPDCSG
jgi:hypothetical protein